MQQTTPRRAQTPRTTHPRIAIKLYGYVAGSHIYYTPLPIWKRDVTHTIEGHTSDEKTQLQARVRRLRGQVEAIERALGADEDCAKIMQLVVSVRGAANSLMAELLEDHIRLHVCDPTRDRDRERARGTEDLLEIVHAYLR